MNLDFNKYPNPLYFPLEWYQNADFASTVNHNFQCYAPQDLSLSGMQSEGHSSYESNNHQLHFTQLYENIQKPSLSPQMLFEDQNLRHNYSHPNYNGERYNSYLGNKCEYTSNIYQNETNTGYGSYYNVNNREEQPIPHSMSN